MNLHSLKTKISIVLKNYLLHKLALAVVISVGSEWLCNIYIEQGYYKFYLTSSGYIVNFLLVFTITHFLSLLTKRHYMSLFTVLATCIFLTVINIGKQVFLDAPFFLSDFLLTYQFFSLIPKYWKMLLLPTVSLLVLLFFTYKLVRFLWKLKSEVNKNYRLISLGGFTLLLIAILLAPKAAISKIEKDIHLSENYFNVSARYRENGFLYSFFMEIRDSLHSKEPPHYNKQDMQKLFKFELLAYRKYLKKNQFEKDKVNIIYYLGESFYDPKKIGIAVYPDPLSNFRKIAKDSLTGEMVMPVKGGQTANAEFEILTSLSTNFISGIAYTSSIKKPIKSIASNLKNLGYSTIAIHSFVKWYWSRDFVYPKLGFEKFHTWEFLKDQTKAGYYISDQAMIRSSFSLLEKTNPIFLYLIGMVSHGPYVSNYTPVNFRFKSQFKIAKPKQLQTNLNLLKDVDLALANLIKKLKTIKKKYIVLFFGDHYPLHDHIGKTFTNATKNKSEESYSLPFLVWSNYSKKHEKIYISANYITPTIYKYFNLKMNLHQYLIHRLKTQNPKFSKSIQNSSKLSEPQLTKFINKYQIIQHDILTSKNLLNQVFLAKFD